jgi:hypothetical protein
VAVIKLGATGMAATTTPAFADGVALGAVATPDIWEASGVVASRQNPGVLWTHNDSGYRGTVFALSTNGTLLGRYTVPEVSTGDFEDIAMGPGPRADREYIYLGDIGDNNTNRTSIRVFRFAEPAVYGYQSNEAVRVTISDAQAIELRYPDGPYNAEALLVDPRTGDLFIATKLTNSSRIYRATRAELDAGGPVELTFMREISFRLVSGGDVSRDGSLVALRRNNRASAWVRKPGQSVSDALAGTSITIPVIGQPEEPNGEALGFDPEDSGYYTLSEGFSPTVYYIARTDSGKGAAAQVWIGPGEGWSYQDFGWDEGTEWRGMDFDDSWWKWGPAQLGYGEGVRATELFAGPDESQKTTTTYFRKGFEWGGMTGLSNLVMRICFTDGVAVYVNGIEILRRNLGAGAAFDTLASGSNSAGQNVWLTFPVDPALLRPGENVVAVEVHRFAPEGPDLSFDLQLLEGTVETPARFTGPPEILERECRIAVAGPVGLLVSVDGSEDLLGWGRAGRVILTNGTGIFRETITNSRARFFRIGQ